MGINNNQSTTQNITVEKMLKYMEEKYVDGFSYVDSVDGGFNKNEKYILVSNDKLSGKEIKVVYRNDEGVETFADNYVHLKYEEQTKNLINKLLGKLFSQKIILDYQIKGISQSNSFSSSTSFEEFRNNAASEVVFYAVLSGNTESFSDEELSNKLELLFKDEFPYCKGYLYFAENEDDFKSVYELPNWKLKELRQVEFETKK